MADQDRTGDSDGATPIVDTTQSGPRASVGRATQASAAERVGNQRVGDFAIDVPESGSATRGAAVGAGMNREPADIGPGAGDPGGDNALAGNSSDPAGAGPGAASRDDNAGSVRDFETAFDNRQRSWRQE